MVKRLNLNKLQHLKGKYIDSGLELRTPISEKHKLVIFDGLNKVIIYDTHNGLVKGEIIKEKTNEKKYFMNVYEIGAFSFDSPREMKFSYRNLKYLFGLVE
jgi:hypothetical protein